MKTAYFDCFSGISGDMIVGALLDAGLDFEHLENELKKLGLKNYDINAEKISKGNIASTKFNVITNDAHPEERNIDEINSIIDESSLNDEIKSITKKIFLKIAEAESKIHNLPVGRVHFHEIGAIDTIIDVAGAIIGIKRLGIEKICCSKINVGNGFVEFSHGKFPVPAPATVEILKGIPIYSTDVNSELATPTGAAIISVLAESFGEMPEMKVGKIGYGAGTEELKQPNVLRVLIGETGDIGGKNGETVDVIETNIDNMNPEIYPHVIDRLMEKGALDACLTNIIMKKGRPGIKLTVLSRTADAGKLCKVIFDETATIGLRIRQEKRQILERETEEIDTKYGKIRVKISRLDGEIKNITPEFEECRRAAEKHNVPLKDIYKEIRL